MANATVQLTVNPFPKGFDRTQRTVIVRGTAVITANSGTSAATGLPISWGSMTDGNFGSGNAIVPQVGPNQIAAGPINAWFQTTGGATSAQSYSFSTANNSLIVWRAGAAVETGITADTLTFEAEFAAERF